MNLRQQLSLKQSLRRLRTWAPPISLGVIFGCAVFLAVERLAPATDDAPPAQAAQVVIYQSCDDARAAGAAPLRLGQPGYNRRLDHNRDGLACETDAD